MMRHKVLSFRSIFCSPQLNICLYMPTASLLPSLFPLASPVISSFPTCHQLIKGGVPTEPVRRDPLHRCTSVLAAQSAKIIQGSQVVCKQRWAESSQAVTEVSLCT